MATAFFLHAHPRPLLPNESAAFVGFSVVCLAMGCALAFPVIELGISAYAAANGIGELPPHGSRSFAPPSAAHVTLLLLVGMFGSLLCSRLPCSTRTLLFVTVLSLLLVRFPIAAALLLSAAALATRRLRSLLAPDSIAVIPQP